MSVVDISPEMLDARAANAANAAIREAGPDTTWSPMGAMPPSLLCDGPHRQRVIVHDRHGTPHITACCLILEARREWGYAHPDDLHVFRVPSRPPNPTAINQISPDLELVPGVGYVLDAGELGGPAFAPPFVDYLDFPHEPIVRALRQYRVKCAGQHSTWSEHRGQAICGNLLWSTIANGNLLAEAAEANGLTYERAYGLLGEALRLIWSWRARTINGI